MAEIDALIKARAIQAVKLLRDYTEIGEAYIFGSYAEGKEDQYSDIDLGIFIEEFEKWDLFKMSKISAIIQKKAGDDLELHFFSNKDSSHLEKASFANYVKQHGYPLST
ncbi:nucleotidyltransferase domain-containing protein [bacterium]|nr:nucleotidyltransferase domain-containing protein [bacterium]